jgi:NAD(P)H-dependent FMN reductase
MMMGYRLKRFAIFSMITTTTNRYASSKQKTFANALNICVLVGSTRVDGPPRPILSDRVSRYIESSINSRTSKHDVSILNAKDLSLMKQPHFSYSKSQCPTELNEIHEILKNGDAYIIITPEYNHSPCPGLMNLMNHFGSSTFSFKPSGIVSYSAGQWGGTRAAHSLRPFLSELGCLPVSAMVHIPKAMDVLNEKGEIIDKDEEERWADYIDRMIYQVEFWAQAAKNQKLIENPSERSPAFVKEPSERNSSR